MTNESGSGGQGHVNHVAGARRVYGGRAVDPFGGDLLAVLAYTAPGASSVTRAVRLFDLAPGGFDARAFDGSYSVGSSFTTPLPGSLVRPGDYASVETLSGAFVGQPIAGTYQVQVSDAFSNGGATVGGVDLAFDVGTTSTVPEPATVALLGGGLLGVYGAARRRRRERHPSRTPRSR